MEDIKIKDYIIKNFKDDDPKTLGNAIDECLKENDEVTLPGMGVFLGLIWEGSNQELKKSMLDILYKKLHK